MGVEIPRGNVYYNPSYISKGVDYYSIGEILYILDGQCDRDEIRDLCDRALSERPWGRELRNQYLLPIRAGLQEWTGGYLLHMILKMLLSRILDDTTAGGVFSSEQLTLNTVVAWDQSKLMDEAIYNV